MTVRAIFENLATLPSYRLGMETYDPTKLGLGNLMVKVNGGETDPYVGPLPIGLGRPMEQSTAIASIFPWGMQWVNTPNQQIDWVFLADGAVAAATRRINAYTFNRLTGEFNWKGFITVTFPTATVFTIRAFRMTYDKYRTGTAAVANGINVTGTTTLWSAPNLSIGKPCAGNRIGFGSNDPSQITTWYTIASVNSNTSITLASAAPDVPAGTPYVIEDLRAVVAATNATAGNGGLFVIKGLSFDLFSNVGGVVPAAGTEDNIRACYWLANAPVVTNTVSFGMGIDTATSWNNQNVYILDGLANPVVFKYNIRAPLTLTAGKSTDAFVFKTGAGGVVAGVPTQANNGRLATVNHGAFNNINTLFFTTSTRIYATPLQNITQDSTTWLSGGGVATEVPPGGVATFTPTGALSSLEYASKMDRFIVATNALTVPHRSYVTQFFQDGSQWERIFGCDIRQLDQSNADSTSTPVPTLTGGPQSVWAENGLLYVAMIGATAAINRLYAIPIGADWEYNQGPTDSCVITPKFQCKDIRNYINIFVNETKVVGGKTGFNLGIRPEPYRIKYRTTGIDDNTGVWNLINDNGDMSSISGTMNIQLRLEFRTIGNLMVPARVNSLGVVYEDNGTDDHFQFSSTKSIAANKQFAWRLANAFNGNIPKLYIRLYDAVTNALLINDDTIVSASGTFEKSLDGTTWIAYDVADKVNETTYIRYTPSSLADNISVRAVLSIG